MTNLYWRDVPLDDPQHTLHTVPVRTAEVSLEGRLSEEAAELFASPEPEREWRFTLSERVPSAVKRGRPVRWYVNFNGEQRVLVGRVKYRYRNVVVLVGRTEP